MRRVGTLCHTVKDAPWPDRTQHGSSIPRVPEYEPSSSRLTWTQDVLHICYDRPVEEWTIEYYETADGYSPVREYLDALPEQDAAQVAFEIDLLGDFGTSLGMPHVRSIHGSKLWELRSRGRNHHRVFYVAVRGRTILLLHAFAKKTQKTPAREIKMAERRLVDYEGRSGR